MSDSTRVAASDRKPPYFAGVDVGGTNIKLGIVDDLGQSLIQDSIPTDEERGPVDAMQRVAETAASDDAAGWSRGGRGRGGRLGDTRYDGHCPRDVAAASQSAALVGL